MKRSLTILFIAGIAAAGADDPGGWSKAKWGMTDAQILAAFPDQAVQLDPPERNGARIAIKGFDLAGAHFQVYFLPNSAGALERVVLIPGRLPSPELYDALFQDLENLLVDKYGRAWKSDEAGTTELQWSFKTTTIILSRAKVAGFGTQFVTLSYKRKSGDADKV